MYLDSFFAYLSRPLLRSGRWSRRRINLSARLPTNKSAERIQCIGSTVPGEIRQRQDFFHRQDNTRRREVYSHKVVSTIGVKYYRASASFYGIPPQANSSRTVRGICWFDIALSGIVQFSFAVLLVDLGQEPVRIVLVPWTLHCDFLMVCTQRTRGP